MEAVEATLRLSFLHEGLKIRHEELHEEGPHDEVALMSGTALRPQLSEDTALW